VTVTPSETDDVPVLYGEDLVAVCDRYLPLVHHAVSSYAYRLPSYVDLDDLTGAATIGLVEAARRFDPSKGVPFEPWALQRIRGAILDAARSADFASRKTRSAARDMDRVTEDLTQKLGRVPTAQEVAEEIGMSAQDLSSLKARVHQGLVVSLDATMTYGEDDSVSYAATLVDADMGPLETLERCELDAYLRDSVELLPERLRTLIRDYFFDNKSSAEIAQEMGVTESRVSQLRTEALRMLRTAIASQYDDIYQRTMLPTDKTTPNKAKALAAAVAAKSSYRSRLEPENITSL